MKNKYDKLIKKLQDTIVSTYPKNDRTDHYFSYGLEDDTCIISYTMEYKGHHILSLEAIENFDDTGDWGIFITSVTDTDPETIANVSSLIKNTLLIWEGKQDSNHESCLNTFDNIYAFDEKTKQTFSLEEYNILEKELHKLHLEDRKEKRDFWYGLKTMGDPNIVLLDKDEINEFGRNKESANSFLQWIAFLIELKTGKPIIWKQDRHFTLNTESNEILISEDFIRDKGWFNKYNLNQIASLIYHEITKKEKKETWVK